MPLRFPRLLLSALALALLAGCGGGDEAGAGDTAPGGASAAPAPTDSALNASFTVDTQATPGDTAAP
jgi:hypothetical protein